MPKKKRKLGGLIPTVDIHGEELINEEQQANRTNS